MTDTATGDPTDPLEAWVHRTVNLHTVVCPEKGVFNISRSYWPWSWGRVNAIHAWCETCGFARCWHRGRDNL